jgi:hypothetical protein
MKKIIIKESSLKRLVENLQENYDSNKLYKKSYILDRIKNAPKQIKKYTDLLPDIECYDAEGNQQVCTRIPEVLFVYLTGRY